MSKSLKHFPNQDINRALERETGESMIDIEQAITAYNDQRESLAALRSKAKRKQLYLFATLAVLLAAMGLWIYFSGSDKGLYLVPLAGIFGLIYAFEMLNRSADQPGEDLQKALLVNILPALFSNVQDLRFHTITDGFFQEIPDTIKPDAKRYECGDMIEGMYRGQSFAINLVTAFNTRGLANDRNVVKIFRGLALRIGLDHSVPNLTVCSDPGAFQQLIMEQYRAGGVEAQRPFEDEYFETIFDVHCKNEAFANSIFSDAGRATFMSLQGIVSKSPIDLAAIKSTAYVLLSLGDENEFLQLPSIDHAFDVRTDGQRLQNEMQRLLDLIEGVRDLLKTGSAT